MWKLIALFIILLAFAMGYFIWENSDENIIITFYGVDYSTNLGIALSITFVCGAIFMLIFSMISEMKLRSYIRKLKKTNQKMKNDLIAAKNYSVEEEK